MSFLKPKYFKKYFTIKVAKKLWKFLIIWENQIGKANK